MVNKNITRYILANTWSLTFFGDLILKPEVRIGLTFLLYESNVLPLNYSGILANNKRPSFALLLKTLFLRPFPRLSPAYVGVSASQFGQIKRRLISILFRQL